MAELISQVEILVVLEVEEVLLIILHIMVEVVHQAKVMQAEEVASIWAEAEAEVEVVPPQLEVIHQDQMDLKQVVLVVMVYHLQ
tara:strand:- start:228 stop:479 length:252 start_codon:yes stop_codon:yes gene_type:complete